MLNKIGFSIFLLASLYASFRIANEPPSGHFLVFTSAAQALWNGQNPYGTDYGSLVGPWFYSPACGVFFFTPFLLFTFNTGVALFLLLSWLTFLWGASRFWASISLVSTRKAFQDLGVFWLLVTPQVYSALVSTKIELLMTGLVFLSASGFADPNPWKRTLSAFLLGFITNWKLQPLPTAGLLALASMLATNRKWLWPTTFILSLALWFVLPLVWIPTHLLTAMHETWANSLGSFTHEAWLHFDNLFAFSQNALGLHYSYEAGMTGALVIGTAIAVSFCTWCLKTHPKPSQAALLALAVGAFFTASFSPLQQNNAYILVAPLFLATHKLPKCRWVVATAFFLMAFAYSDIMPSLLEDMRSYTIKPVGPLILCVALLTYGVRATKTTS